MALYTCITPSSTGALATGVAVSSADTISGNDVANGAILLVTVGVTPTNVTFTDPGHTPAGTGPGSVTPVTVAANTTRAFGKLAAYVDPSSNTLQVNYSSTATATAQVVA